jgi:hypothetical protein
MSIQPVERQQAGSPLEIRAVLYPISERWMAAMSPEIPPPMITASCKRVFT